MNNDDSDIVYLKKTRGVVLLLSGYKYYKNRSYKDGAIVWRCSSKNKENGCYDCSGSLTIMVGYLKLLFVVAASYVNIMKTTKVFI